MEQNSSPFILLIGESRQETRHWEEQLTTFQCKEKTHFVIKMIQFMALGLLGKNEMKKTKLLSNFVDNSYRYILLSSYSWWRTAHSSIYDSFSKANFYFS